MLKATTYNDLIIEKPDRIDEIVKDYSQFMKQLHKVEMEQGELPDAKKQFIG